MDHVNMPSKPRLVAVVPGIVISGSAVASVLSMLVFTSAGGEYLSFASVLAILVMTLKRTVWRPVTALGMTASAYYAFHDYLGLKVAPGNYPLDLVIVTAGMVLITILAWRWTSNIPWRTSAFVVLSLLVFVSGSILVAQLYALGTPFADRDMGYGMTMLYGQLTEGSSLALGIVLGRILAGWQLRMVGHRRHP